MKILKANPSGSVTYAGMPINKEPVNKDSIEGMKPETDKMVTGIFKNMECPGQTAFICMRLYKGQQPFTKLFHDGQTYTIPLSVARMINRSCKYKKDKHMLDEHGESVKVDDVPIDRYKFISADYQ